MKNSYNMCSISKNMKDIFLLDNCSTDTIICNPDYCWDIRNSDKELTMTKNRGPMKSNQKCTIEHLKEVWYNPNSITNILALCDVTKKFKVTMDTSEEKAMLVHLPDKIIQFDQSDNGLYILNPKEKKSQQHVTTVEENIKFLSACQQDRAKKA